jgi:hypothetical protein
MTRRAETRSNLYIVVHLLHSHNVMGGVQACQGLAVSYLTKREYER